MKSRQRQILHDLNREEIKTIAWKQITEKGFSSLSMGAIAREIGMTPPALYRYFASREDLVNALICDTFLLLHKTLADAQKEWKPDQYVERFRAFCTAFHHWGIHNPQKYTLILGIHIPGEKLSLEAGKAADKCVTLFLDLLSEAEKAGKIHPSPIHTPLTKELEAYYKELTEEEKTYSPQVVELSLFTIDLLYGITSLELFKLFSVDKKISCEGFFQLEIERLIQMIGLE